VGWHHSWSWADCQGRNGASRAKRRGRSTKKHPPLAGAYGD